MHIFRKNKAWKFLKERKKTIILLIILMSSLGITRIISRDVVIVGFLSLILVFILSGLGFARLFDKQFLFRGWLGYLTNSLVLGIFVIVVALQLLGLLGFVYTNATLICLFTGIICINIFLCLFLPGKLDKKLQIKRQHNNFVDIIAFCLILFLFILIVKIGLENYTYSWDSFTFWAVDSKYLFEERVLRDSSFDVLSESKYSSLYSSMIFLTYIFYKGIYEQFSSLITILFAFLSFLLLFNRVRFLRSVKKKTIIYTTFAVVLVSFLLLQNIIITQYADVFNSFLVLLFSLILLESKPNPNAYSKRFFLLSLICLFFYLTKSMYIYVGIILFLIFILHDLLFLKRNFFGIFKKKKMLIVIFFLMFYIFLIHKYLSTFVIERELAIPERPVYVLSDYIRYVYDLFFHVSENVPLIMLLYGSFLTILFLQFPRKRQGVFSLIISFVSILLPVGFFIITLRQDFGSKSLLRYMTLGHFLLPFTYMYVEDDRESKFTNTLSFLAMVFISLILIMFVWVLYGINIKWKVNEGTYSVPLMKYAQIAEKAKASVGVGEDILLVDSLGGEPSKLANMDVPGIFLRYYLDEYSVGKQYSLPVGQFEKYLNDFVNPDYLLILEYDGYFNGCNVLLSQGGSYLVPYELDIELFNEDICPFDRNEIINLGE